VLAAAIFSLAIAKPGVAYAHSHLNLGGLSDIGDYLNVHPCAHGHHLCGLLGIAGGLIGTAHAGPLGSIAGKWAGDKADELIKQHYHEEEDGAVMKTTTVLIIQEAATTIIASPQASLVTISLQVEVVTEDRIVYQVKALEEAAAGILTTALEVETQAEVEIQVKEVTLAEEIQADRTANFITKFSE